MRTRTTLHRATAVALICLGVALPLMAQISETPTDGGYAQGRSDGQRDAQGSLIWAAAGFFCGCFGVLGAYLISPGSPPASSMIGKSADYARGYSEGWSKKTKEKNGSYALGGCAIAMLISSIISLISTLSN